MRAFSTLEILLAMVIAVTTMSSLILLSFGTQSAILNGQTNTEALLLGQKLLEQQQANAKQDFTTVAASGPTTNGIYTTSVTVTPSADLLTKTVTALVTWFGDHNQPLSVKLTTLVTDPQGGSGSCNPSLIGDWAHPRHYDFDSTALVPGNQSNGIGVSDIKIKSQKMFVTAYSVNNSNHKFYIFSLHTDPSQAPTYVSSLDTAPTTADGLNAVAINGNYAYVANAHDSNFQTCTEGANCAQLQVIDISNTASPSVARSYKLPATSGPQVLGNMTSTGQAVGKSIFYKDGYLYVGLTKTASGPEFNIINVQAPTNPVWVGSYAVGRTVNQIYVKDNYAYLTTDDNARELLILDITNKASPVAAGLYDAPGSTGFGYGEAVAVSGNSVYLGRSYDSTNPELYVLNGTNPATTLPVSGSLDVGTSANTDSIYGVTVRTNLLFMLTNKQFGIYDISNPSSITQYATLSLSSFAQGNPNNISGTASNCTGNYFYVAIKTPQGQNKDDISVIIPGGVDPTLTEVVHDASHATVTTAVAGDSVHAATTVAGSVGTPTGTVTYTFYSNASCTGSGTGAGTVTLASSVADPSTTEGPLSVGSYSFKAHYNGDFNYNAYDACVPLTVAKANQAITVTTHAPASAAYNTTFPVAATASSGLSVVVTTTGPCSIAGSTVTMTSGTGSCVVHYNQAGNSNYNAATEVTETVTATKVTPTITWTNPADITYGTALSATQLNASTGVAGTFTYTPGSGTQLNVGANQTLSVHFAPTATANYNTPADKTVLVNVLKAPQNIAINTAAPGSAAYGSSFTVAATGGASGNPVVVSTSGACTNSGFVVTMTSGTGTCTVFYNQAGNSNYNAAAQLTNTTNATKVLPKINAVIVYDLITGLATTSVRVNRTVFATTTVSGVGAVPSGTVNYDLYINSANNNCTNGTKLSGGSITVSASGVARSNNYTPTATTGNNKSNFYIAHYLGDTNYLPIDDSCRGFTVQ